MYKPDPRPGEDGLGQDGAFKQVGVGQRDHGDEREQHVAEGMAPDDLSLGEGL